MSRNAKLAGGAVALLLALAAVWFLFLKEDAPPEVSLADAVAQVDGEEDAAEAEGDDDPDVEPDATEDDAPASDGEPDIFATGVEDINGLWLVDTTVGSSVDTGTFAGYRVDEELRGVGAVTATGRSPEVSGSLSIADGVVETVLVTVDMTALQSDSSNRDNAIRSRGIESDTFPEAQFLSTAPIELPADAADGAQFSVEVEGTLTLHGVERAVVLPLDAQLVDDRIVAVGSLEIAMADYDIVPPQVGPVLGISDVGTMEFQLFLGQSAS